jgi:hypothetical protein
MKSDCALLRQNVMSNVSVRPNRCEQFPVPHVRCNDSEASRFACSSAFAGTVIIKITESSKPVAIKMYEAAGLPVAPFR